MTNRIETLTPNEAWEQYVGAQSTREFIDAALGTTPIQEFSMLRSIAKYVRSCELCAGLSESDQVVVARKLYEHIGEL